MTVLRGALTGVHPADPVTGEPLGAFGMYPADPTTGVATGSSFTGTISMPTSTITRPADTTAYAANDLIANSTTAGSVVFGTFTATSVEAGAFEIRNMGLRKSGTSNTNAFFRVHLYSAAPTPSNGDNAAWLTPLAGYIGAFDVATDRVFTDGTLGTGLSLSGLSRGIKLASGTTLAWVLEARAAYTPISEETFTVVPEIWQL